MMRLLRAVYGLYPRWWWQRYGAELEALVEDGGAPWPTIADLALSAIVVRLRQRAPVEASPWSAISLFWSPSGMAPIAMSIGALATIAGHIVTSGVAPQTDEGAAAHIWQLLMACQLPVVIWFALRWIPRRGRAAIAISVIQVGAIAAALFPVWWFNW